MTTLTMIKLLFVLCIYIEIIVSEGPYIHHIYLFRELSDHIFSGAGNNLYRPPPPQCSQQPARRAARPSAAQPSTPNTAPAHHQQTSNTEQNQIFAINFI